MLLLHNCCNIYGGLWLFAFGHFKNIQKQQQQEQKQKQAERQYQHQHQHQQQHHSQQKVSS
ncbi:hypothetical protein DOY81_007951 [Sarcophaga bullata]|nr:hypothetical protein DOY81_007951 [Sarcophaga bullata]